MLIIFDPATTSELGFHRVVADDAQIHGPARLMWAEALQPMPERIADVISLEPATMYDAQPGWNDLGSTKAGTRITLHESEITFYDQITGSIASGPEDRSLRIETQLAEVTLSRIAHAWDLAPAVAGELALGSGRGGHLRLAVLHEQRGLVRVSAFSRAYRPPQESSYAHHRVGGQQVLPCVWSVYPDPGRQPDSAFGVIIQQV